MKKILRVTTVSSSISGLLKGQLAFISSYFKIIAVSSDKKNLQSVKQNENVDIYFIDMKRKISLWSDCVSLFHLCRYFHLSKPHIVHANTPKASLLSMVAAKLVGVPHRIYTVTGLRFETATGLFRKLLIAMERLTCACASKVIPEGKGVKNTLIREKITRKPLEVIHNGNINGIDTSYFCSESVCKSKEQLRSEYNIDKDDFVFIFVGRIVKDKGINELISTFKIVSEKHSKAKLLLVGSYEKELDPIALESEQEIEKNPKIIYFGYQRDVRPFFKMADALAFPSYREGFPNVVMQAGAMGLPSIVTDINGCNEIIIEDENGVIIPPKNVKALTEAMEKFIVSFKLVEKLSLNARKLICDRYEQKDVWNAILKMYQNLDNSN